MPWLAMAGLPHQIISLRSKRFRGVGEQRKTKERYFAREKLGREQFFTPEPHGNACYGGYQISYGKTKADDIF